MLGTPLHPFPLPALHAPPPFPTTCPARPSPFTHYLPCTPLPPYPLPALQELQALLDEYLRCSSGLPLDPVALQGELMVLRVVLRDKEKALQQMEATGLLRWRAGGVGR